MGVATVEAAVDVVQAVLAQRSGVVATYLFGSAARGAPDARDLDLAVMFADGVDGFREALYLQVELETKVDFPVDVHDFAALPVDFQFRVLDEGRVVIDHDHRERVRRDVRTQAEYYDFKPYLDRIQAGALRRMAAKAHG